MIIANLRALDAAGRAAILPRSFRALMAAWSIWEKALQKHRKHPIPRARLAIVMPYTLHLKAKAERFGLTLNKSLPERHAQEGCEALLTLPELLEPDVPVKVG